ncbi:SGNH/GDSL hydrolase family protein [Devosia chinhatensis]|uniref:Arylesterase n=1 Tax=Devosia chinhatensis TaxID=429727 RepID=A0A0F5FLX6_9HYPH|nr:SGNH/GDSL hydrolase family protein [Devosia chinhatensis]KKB09540.1 arylesterase [Devosia chinhatensis]
MKTILAFGDSLTYGADPHGGPRHAYEDRWPTALERGLAGQARVIAEGLGGRTTVFDDFSSAADRNGARVLPTLLDSHKPLDLVVIMLGTNDLKVYLNGTAFGAAMGVKRLVQIIRQHPYDAGQPVPEVIIVAPPLTVETDHADLHAMFAPRADEAKLFDVYYSRVARDLGAGYFNAANVAVADRADGVHLDAANTRAIGDGLVPLVKQVLGF